MPDVCRDLVPLAAGDVVLRRFTTADVPALLSAFADADIARWNSGPAGDTAGVLDWLNHRNDWSGGEHASWAIAHRRGPLLGSVSLHKIDLDQCDAEIGYWIAPWARGRRRAVAAVTAAAAFAFAELGPGLGLHRVYLYHAVENAGSCRVAARTGFELEGTLRKSFRYADGAYHDEHLHARLAADQIHPSRPPEDKRRTY